MLSLRPIRRFCHAAAITAIAPVAETVTSAKSNCIKKPDKPLEEPALVKLKAERDPERLFQLFKANAHNRLVVENRFAFEDTVSRLAGAGRFDYIEHLLEHQKTLPQGRREGFIVRIIMLYGKAGMIKQAVDTFYDMHLFGCQRTVKSFNAALKVLTQSHDLEAIDLFLKDALCDMDILDKAYMVMIEMEKAGVNPDVVTYTTLISAFYKSNRWEVGNGLWNLMVMKGCLPNLATFNVRIQYLVNRRRAWQANSLMGMMEYLGLTRMRLHIIWSSKGFARLGYKPNVKIYQTMIHYLCKGGEFAMAYTMCKDCMNRNWSLNIDKAKVILRLAWKRVPSFSKNQLGVFESVLSKKQ
ncbi:hypothetical protein AAG906_000089 [Vitis piasezkii]